MLLKAKKKLCYLFGDIPTSKVFSHRLAMRCAVYIYIGGGQSRRSSQRCSHAVPRMVEREGRRDLAWPVSWHCGRASRPPYGNAVAIYVFLDLEIFTVSTSVC